MTDAWTTTLKPVCDLASIMCLSNAN